MEAWSTLLRLCIKNKERKIREAKEAEERKKQQSKIRHRSINKLNILKIFDSLDDDIIEEIDPKA